MHTQVHTRVYTPPPPPPPPSWLDVKHQVTYILTSPPQNNNKTMHAYTHKCCALISTEEHASEKIVGEWWWKFLVALVAHLANARLSPLSAPDDSHLLGCKTAASWEIWYPCWSAVAIHPPPPLHFLVVVHAVICQWQMMWLKGSPKLSSFFYISSGQICRLPFYNTCLPRIYIYSYRFHMRLRSADVSFDECKSGNRTEPVWILQVPKVDVSGGSRAKPKELRFWGQVTQDFVDADFITHDKKEVVNCFWCDNSSPKTLLQWKLPFGERAVNFLPNLTTKLAVLRERKSTY